MPDGTPPAGTLVGMAQALAEPARLAIEKLCGGLGRLYEPTHVRRMSKAKADKAFIDAIGKADLAELLEAAENREAYRKLRQETNLKMIADRASRLFESELPPGSAAPADEWVDEFTDQSKDASSDELRELWARLYVAETARAGAAPRRVLRVVRDLDATLAKSFTRALGCSVTNDSGQIVLLLFRGWLEGLDFTDRSFRELQDVGLIEPPSSMNQQLTTGVYRFNEEKFLRVTFEEGKKLMSKPAYLTSAGIAIAAVAEKRVDERYVQNLRKAAEAAGARTEYPLMKQAGG
jgi:hypothetical protein